MTAGLFKYIQLLLHLHPAGELNFKLVILIYSGLKIHEILAK